ncbi:hypothetical protein B0H17DRAFT_1135906 [Mycena rosella]|uniref:Uncharacterized protein n=1 Tax=Mycena rosella TaxID=1033263 RepID=A0AAD7DCI1_MYCRO|nr:hypothetical protein B0H17DRAFT_1135906 [Mycena rosella]
MSAVPSSCAAAHRVSCCPARLDEGAAPTETQGTVGVRMLSVWWIESIVGEVLNIRGGGNSRDRQWTATFGSGNQWGPAYPLLESAGVHWGTIVPVAPDRSPVEFAGVQSMQTQ